MKIQENKRTWIRLLVQVFFFVLIGIIAYNHTLAEDGRGLAFLSSASLHTLCPFGGVVSLYQYITTGTLVKKVHESAIILMYISFFMAILFGPVLCGWICPLGSIQEWFSKIGQKIFKKKFNRFIPYKIDKYLRFLRYAVLAWVIYMTAVSSELIFNNFDPYSALFHFWSSELATGGAVVLIITLLASLFVERPWCKYACPYGALLGITNLFSIFKIRRRFTTCIDCDLCDISCPMNIEVSTSNVVRNHQCISCLKCTSEEACPVSGTVVFSSAKLAHKEASKNEN